MKLFLKSFLILICGLSLITACSKEEPEEEMMMEEEMMVDPCADVDASYKDDIRAILDGSCALTGCHVEGFSKGDFSVFQNVSDNAAKIKSRAVTQKNMPPAASSAPKLTDAQVELLNCWIESGAEDN